MKVSTLALKGLIINYYFCSILEEYRVSLKTRANFLTKGLILDLERFFPINASEIFPRDFSIQIRLLGFDFYTTMFLLIIKGFFNFLPNYKTSIYNPSETRSKHGSIKCQGLYVFHIMFDIILHSFIYIYI